MKKFKNILIINNLGFIGFNFSNYLLENFNDKLINVNKATYSNKNSKIYNTTQLND